MMSYWEKKQFFYQRDLVICGAGFTGLSAGIYYKKKYPNRSVLILEMDTINGGASTKNAGFACFGSPSELIADVTISPEEEVFALVEKRFLGLQNLRSLFGDEKIGFEKNHGFELFRQDDPLYKTCIEKMHYLNQQLKPITGKEVYKIADQKIGDFGFRGIHHMIENIEEGQVDTGKMYYSLLQMAKELGVEIFNGIRVRSYQEGTDVSIDTTSGRISCKQFLIANNGFAASLLPGADIKPARAQVLITAPIKDLKVRGTFHMDEGFYYFRNVDDRILFGGGRNLDFEGETTTELNLADSIQSHLEELLRTVIIPEYDFAIGQRWAGVMGMGSNKKVIVQELSAKVFCAIRLSGMGLALSTLLGKEVVEMMD